MQICTERDDVLLTAAGGQCIRFAVTDVRVFAGRSSMGVRGIQLDEGDKVRLRELNEHATQPKFVYVHQWRVGDLVMWDNRQMMHRVRRYDESQPRDMRRTTVAGTAATTAQA